MAPLRELGSNDLDAAHDQILGRKARGGKRGGGECESRSTSKGASGGKKAPRTKAVEGAEAEDPWQEGAGKGGRKERRREARERSCSRRRARSCAESKEELATDDDGSPNSEAENTPNSPRKVRFCEEEAAEDPVAAQRRRAREAREAELEAREAALQEEAELEALRREAEAAAAAASAALGAEAPARVFIQHNIVFRPFLCCTPHCANRTFGFQSPSDSVDLNTSYAGIVLARHVLHC